MRLLLDTHAFLWWREDNRALRVDARQAIATASAVFVSAASAWEIAIKVRLGKLRVPQPVEEAVVASGFSTLPIVFRHAAEVGVLGDHHTDPFDRMLIAQARVEHLTIVTHHRAFEPYGVPVLWT